VRRGPGAGGGKLIKGKARSGSVSSGGNTFQFLTLSNTGKHPEARADGDKLVVGGQTVTAKDGVLSFER
jgi:hypothetical protein